ncbi:MAG: transcription termination/antitermination protein NusA [Clostridia bacterium]|nr:transcription termination/antitermination protein NusA [Clostridia bacterium]
MNTDLRDAIAVFQKEKGISEELLCEKICNAVATAARKEFGVKAGIVCELDENYELHLCRRQTVAEEVLDPDLEISLEDARAIKEDAVYGDVIETPLQLANLGRIAAQSVKHIVRQGVREIEHEQILKDFQSKNKEIVTAKVVNVNPVTGDATVEISKSEALLPKKDQIPGEKLNVGDLIKIYVVDVKETEKGPKVIISRINTGLVKRLFEQEVPEIFDGTVEIKSVSREAGSRTKIAVWSKDENIDPIGACIGPRGSRVNAIINLLGGEKIDIVKYSENPREYIGAALSPAEIVSVEVTDEAQRTCRVTVPEAQLSLAIGNKGQNARLAARLTGWKIDIKPYYGDYQPMIQL